MAQLQITTTVIADLTVNVAASRTIQATGGTLPYAWSVYSGTLPVGMTLDSATGIISGTPTTIALYTFELQVDSADGQTAISAVLTAQVKAAAAAHIEIQVGEIITGGIHYLPRAFVGWPYRRAFAAYWSDTVKRVLTEPITWSIVNGSGALPSGLTLTTEQNNGHTSGVITGTPTAATSASFTLQIIDGDGASVTQPYTINVVKEVSLLVGLGQGEQGVAYSKTLTATGGTAPYTYAVTAGALPGNMTLSSGGVLSGTPAAAGEYTFTVRALDAVSTPGTREYVFVVRAPGQVEQPHAFYEAMITRPQLIQSNPLRSQAEIDAASSWTPNAVYTYNFAGDSYVDKQDAAKMTKGPNAFRTNIWEGKSAGDDSVDTHYMLNHYLDTSLPQTPGSVGVYILDFYHAENFHTQMGSVGSWKYINFQDTTPTGPTRVGNVYCHLNGDWMNGEVPKDPQTAVARLAIRPPNVFPQGLTNPPSQAEPEPTGYLAYTRDTLPLARGVWHRAWIEIRFDIPGTAFTSWNHYCWDAGTVPNGQPIDTYTIATTTATNPCTVTTVTPHSFSSSATGHSDTVTITGNTAINGVQTVTVTGTNTFTIPVMGDGASGGTASRNMNMFSMWIASEDHDIWRMLYQLPQQRRHDYMANARIEVSTSSMSESQTGTLIGYYRNLVVLKGLQISDKDGMAIYAGGPVNSLDTTIFKRPVR